MPGGDRTGPMGAGPRTGRGMGYCSGLNQPGYANPGPGFRSWLGVGRGGGRGRRNRFYATGIPGWAAVQPEETADSLQAQANFLKSQLDAIQQQIEELKK